MVGMKGKITQEKLDRMTELRKKGMTYREITAETGASKWCCMRYLRHIKVDRNAVEIAWKKAEKEAVKVLEEEGFSHIVNLNEICPSPYWDYYAERNNEKFLIDVTINQSKNLIDKALRKIEGFTHIILLKVNDKWKFIEIQTRERIIR